MDASGETRQIAPEMTKPRSFLLKYVGARFAGRRMPLDVLGDLAAFRDLLVSYAAAEWRVDHAERERLPKNFEKSISFDLVDIEDGSAMPRIEWYRGTIQQQLPEVRDELEILVDRSYEKVLALFDHATGPAAALELTPDNIRALKRFGSNLLPEEKIEFPGSTGDDGNVVYLNKYRREWLITRGGDSYKRRFDGTGRLLGCSVDVTETNGTIKVDTYEYGAIEVPVSVERVRADFDGSILSEVFFRLHVELDNNDAFRSVVDVFDVDVITPKVMADMTVCRERISSLRSLSDGWHDGSGKAPTHEAAATATRLVSRKPDMAGSYRIFPTRAGGLLIEFVRDGWDYSIEIGASGKLEIYGTEIGGDGEMDTSVLDADSNEFMKEFDLVTGKLG